MYRSVIIVALVTLKASVTIVTKHTRSARNTGVSFFARVTLVTLV